MMRRKLIILLSLLMISAEVWSMGLFDFMKVCLFSEVNGVVTLKGMPVGGVVIVRTAEMDDKVHTDKTISGKDGTFHFDAMYAKSLKKIMPVEMVITQNMVLQYKGDKYLGWKTGKQSSEENTELDDDIKIHLSCELTDKVEIKDQKIRIPVTGMCKWK